MIPHRRWVVAVFILNSACAGGPGIGSSGLCDRDTDCNAGWLCIVGSCRKLCSSSPECGYAERCDGVCEAVENPACRSPADCVGAAGCQVPEGRGCVAGQCQLVPAPRLTPCDDGDSCTTGDTCDGSGVCAGAPGGCGDCSEHADCNDGNPCTTDVCAVGGVCENTNNTIACNDGNPCTESDVCDGGTCRGTAIDCDDGNSCTSDVCTPGSGCTHTFTCSCTLASQCNDNNPCTDDSCAGGGNCVNSPNTASCNDGNACTSGDVCSGGTCAGGDITCNDNLPCTDDTCDPASGCVFVADNSNTCTDDGEPCTTVHFCRSGVCAGNTPPACDDSDPCTTDSCTAGIGCTSQYICECEVDGDCDDGKPCSKNRCIGGACDYTENDATAICSDSNVCTTSDRCSGTVCVGDAIICNDGKPCTDDYCNPTTGCYATADDGNSCSDDGDVCTTNHFCSSGSCAGDTPLVCNDGDPCTTDTCTPGVGCTTQYICECSGAGDCDDGEPCTVNRCIGGACDYSQNDAAASCTDSSACTNNDHCANGRCTGDAITCNDNEPCTDDDCDPATGCYATPDDGNTCSNDNDACTTNHFCSGGTCTGNTPPDCNDDNDCTNDSCNPTTGCINSPNSNPCDDGLVCTVGETCSGGQCRGGTRSGCAFAPLAVGEAFGCYIRPPNDNVACWGHGRWGAVGDGAEDDNPIPADTTGLTDVVQITAGYKHVCALRYDSTVYCWGYNTFGQLGVGTSAGPESCYNSVSCATTPQPVAGLPDDIVQVAAGNYYTCALDSSGSMYCWGSGQDYVLGDDTNSSASSPKPSTAVTGAIEMIAPGGRHNCVKLRAGTDRVQCFGYQGTGQLGNGSSDNTAIGTPQTVVLANVDVISSGEDQTCAVLTNNSVKCWGSGSQYELGNNSTAEATTPTDVSGEGATRLISVEIGDTLGHVCTVLDSGTAECWGYCGSGECADGATTNNTTAGAVSSLTGLVAIETGTWNTCAMSSGGNVYCFGMRTNCALGNGDCTAGTESSPVLVTTP